MNENVPTMLTAVKAYLRISTADFDTDLSELIATCERDLQVKGVETIDETDMFTRQAIKFYCRAYFANGDSKNSEFYVARYEKIADAMVLCNDYNAEETENA